MPNRVTVQENLIKHARNSHNDRKPNAQDRLRLCELSSSLLHRVTQPNKQTAGRCAIDKRPTMVTVDHNPDSAPGMAGIRVHRPRGARLVTKVNCHAHKRRHIAQIHIASSRSRNNVTRL